MVAIKWTAPEGVLGASYSSASDVWSCGVTMWEVFSKGANPWSGLSNEDAFRNIRRGGRLARPEVGIVYPCDYNCFLSFLVLPVLLFSLPCLLVMVEF